MINSIDDIMKLVNAGFNAQQIADLAKLEGNVEDMNHRLQQEVRVPEEPKKEEPKENVQEPKEDVQEPKDQSAEIESLKAQIAALQAANVSANAGEGARLETAQDVIHNVLKDFY